jgi:antitoxin (DNA-binding transcriptional repressor) of toxin-antitoxin stability system
VPFAYNWQKLDTQRSRLAFPKVTQSLNRVNLGKIQGIDNLNNDKLLSFNEMKTYSVRQFSKDFSKILAESQVELIVITKHGKPYVHLNPAFEHPDNERSFWKNVQIVAKGVAKTTHEGSTGHGILRKGT